MIQIINHVWSQCEPQYIHILKPHLLIDKTTYIHSRFGNKRKDYQKSLINRWGKFLTGYVPKLLGVLGEAALTDNASCSYLVDPMNMSRRNTQIAPIPQFKLRPEQEEAITACLKMGRGIVHLPTGTGKTEIFLSLIREIAVQYSFLIIVHTQDIFLQTIKRAEAQFPGQVGRIGAGIIDPNRITIGMIQTLKDLNIEEAFQNLAGVFVDEAHHISKLNGSYAHVLQQLPNTPMRIGFTATLPYIPEGKAALEGYLGPVIYSKATSEVQSLAKPKIIIRRIPETKELAALRVYKDVYEMGIVRNRKRHMIIIEDTVADLNANLSVLILVTKIEHGMVLLRMFRSIHPDIRIEFVYGQTNKEARTKIKD